MLTLSNVRKSYGDLVAVDGLSLTVAEGEIFGLLGPNGAGKSTTVHMAVGLLPPDAGTVTIGDLGPPTHADVRRMLGVAPQALALYDELTGDENLRFLGQMYGLSGARLSARVDAVLALVGLTDRRRDRASTYSGGMKRRLNLAAALVHEPRLLLLDEPTVGVDPQSRNAILDQILALRAAGHTIVYTTHYMEEAARLCDRVGIVDHGKLLAVDTVEGLIRAHGGRPVLVAQTDAGERRIETDDPVRALTELSASHRVDDFHVARASLEQVFLNLTGRRLRD
ncbi:MAG: ABC transporter ATP-binding protein [Acidobacteria bacterium]|nr:ABC transporter ATP-binding protein [Acidobacteriota bacterium]